MSQNQYQFNSKLCIFQFVWAIDSKMYIILGYCKTKIIHCYTMKNLKKNKNVEHRNKNHFHFSRKFFRTQVGPLARWSVPFVFRLWSTILKKKKTMKHFWWCENSGGYTSIFKNVKHLYKPRENTLAYFIC